MVVCVWGGGRTTTRTIDTAVLGQGCCCRGWQAANTFHVSLSAELPVGLSHRSDGVFWLIAMGPPASSLALSLSSSSSCADNVGGGDIDRGVLVALRKGGDAFCAVGGGGGGGGRIIRFQLLAPAGQYKALE